MVGELSRHCGDGRGYTGIEVVISIDYTVLLGLRILRAARCYLAKISRLRRMPDQLVGRRRNGVVCETLYSGGP